MIALLLSMSSCGNNKVYSRAQDVVKQLATATNKAKSSSDLLNAIETFDGLADRDDFDLYELLYGKNPSTEITDEERAELTETLKKTLQNFAAKQQEVGDDGGSLIYLACKKELEKCQRDIYEIEDYEDLKDFEEDLYDEIIFSALWEDWFVDNDINLSGLSNSENEKLMKSIDEMVSNATAKLKKEKALQALEDEEDDDY